MRRIIAVLAITTALLAFNATGAFASCRYHSYMQDGRMLMCTTCCYGNVCNTSCY